MDSLKGNCYKFDAILVGDSRMDAAGVPAQMRKKLKNHRIANFSFGGLGWNTIIFDEIDRILDDASTVNKFIVLGITPQSLTPLKSCNTSYWQYKNRTAIQRLEHRLWGSIAAYFRRIDDKVINNLQGDKTRYHNIRFIDGWSAVDWMPGIGPEYNANAYKKQFQGGIHSRFSQEICDSLIAAIRKWTVSGVKVFAFRVPSTVEMEEVENKYSGFNEKAFAERLHLSGGIWFEFDSVNYRSFDGSHLGIDSALKFSQKLAQKIHKHLL